MRAIFVSYLRLVIIFIFFTTISCTLVQKKNSNYQPVKFFQRTFKEFDIFHVDVKETANGFIVVGEDEFLNTRQDVIALKLDKTGEKSWEKTIDLGREDGAYAVDATSNGFVIAGFTGSNSRGARDALVLHIDKKGNVLWKKTFGDSRDDYATTVKTVKDGFVIAGYTKMRGPKSISYWIARLDKSGNLLWEKFYGSYSINYAYQLLLMKDGLVVVGSTSAFSRKRGVYIVKTGFDGKLKWQKTISNVKYKSAKKINNSIILLCSLQTKSRYFSKSKIFEINNNGEIKWQKELSTKNNILYNDIEVDNDLIYGVASSYIKDKTNVYFITINNKGEVIRENEIQREGRLKVRIIKSVENGFLIAGTKSNPLNNNYSLYIETVSKNFTAENVKKTYKVLPGSKREFLYAILSDNVDLLEKVIKNGADVNTIFYNNINALSLAAKKGKINAVKVLLKHGALVNKKGVFNKYSLLHAAVYGESLWLIKEIKEKYSDLYDSQINNVNYWKETPLAIAIKKNNISIVKFLLNNGAQINLKNSKKSYLVTAIYYNKKEISKYLLTKGADVNQIDYKNKKTALHYAIEKGNYDLVKALLLKNADINAKDINGEKPFHYAVKSTFEICKLLLKHKPKINDKFNSTRFKGLIPLHVAVMLGKDKIVDLLIKNKANIKESMLLPTRFFRKPKGERWSLLAYAIYYRKEKIANLLINAGVDVNSIISNESVKDMTPLHLAIKNNQLSVIMNLLYHGAKIDIKANMGYYGKLTALEFANKKNYKDLFLFYSAEQISINKKLIKAIKKNNYKEVKSILSKNNVDLSYKESFLKINKKKWTYLDFAVHTGNIKIVKLVTEKLLIQKNINYPSQAFDLAIRNKHNKIFKYLYAKFKKTFTKYSEPSMPTAVFSENIEVLKYLIRNKHSIKKHSFNTYTMINYAFKKLSPQMAHIIRNGTELSKLHKNLYAAIYNKDLKQVKKIILSGIDINVNDLGSITPVCWAAFLGQNKIVKLLIENGAVVQNKKMVGDRSAIYWACARGKVETVNLLVKHGADLKSQDPWGYQLIHIAAKNGHANMVDFLLKKGVNIDSQASPSGYPTKAMHVAASYGKINVIKVLLKHKQSINVFNHKYYQETPLMSAIQNKQLKTIKFLIKNNAKVNLASANKETGLHRALYDSNVMSILSLEYMKASFKKRNKIDKAIVRILLEKGANINSLSNSNETPLMYAIKNKKLALAKYLLEKGADYKNINNNNSNLLHVAAQKGDLELTKKLLSKKLDINLINKKGYSPLLYAVINKNIKVISLLLKNKANVNSIIKKGIHNKKTILGITKNYFIWKLLRDSGAKYAWEL